MNLSQANFEKPLPFAVAGRRLQSSVNIDDRGVQRLELLDIGMVLVELEGHEPQMIPMTRVASLVPAQEQPQAAPAKRRGRPPGSKNNRKPDDKQTTAASEGVQGD